MRAQRGKESSRRGLQKTTPEEDSGDSEDSEDSEDVIDLLDKRLFWTRAVEASVG